MKLLVVSATFTITLFVSSACSQTSSNLTNTPVRSTTYPSSTLTANPIAGSHSPSPSQTQSDLYGPYHATQTAYWAQVTETAEAYGAVCPQDYSGIPSDGILSNHNESWAVVTCMSWDDVSSFSIVSNIDQSTKWTLPYESFSWADGGLEFLRAYRWSADGVSVYLIPSFLMIDFKYPGGAFVTGLGLYRFDLHSGRLITILSPDDGFLAFSMSPNERYLAYAYPGNVVNILDLDPLEIVAVITLDPIHNLSGRFAWAYDSSQLIFASGVEGFDEYRTGISLFSYSLNSRNLQPLLINDERMLVPGSCGDDGNIGWGFDGNLQLTSLSQDASCLIDEWILNVPSARFIMLTGTPTVVESLTSGTYLQNQSATPER